MIHYRDISNIIGTIPSPTQKCLFLSPLIIRYYLFYVCLPNKGILPFRYTRNVNS